MPVTVRENLVPMWSPRQNMTKFRNWSHMPKINIYTAPPPTQAALPQSQPSE